MNDRKAYWPALDGLRAVAVFFVLLAHARMPLLRSGGVGVDIFFVLSGFLITGILSREFSERGRIHWKFFYIRRFLRLVPCLILTCGLVAGLEYFEHGQVPWKILGIVLTYTSNWARALFDFPLGSLDHTWSLAIEEQYYLLWPAVVILFEKHLPSSWSKGVGLLILAILAGLYRASLVGVVSPERIRFGLDTHMDGLILGSSLSYVLRPFHTAGGFPVKWSICLSYGFTPFSILGLLALAICFDARHPDLGRYGYFLSAMGAGVLLADLTCSKRSLLRTALSSPIVVYLGRISYGIYLLHFPIFHLIDRFFPNKTTVLPLRLSVGLLEILLSLGAAVLSYGLVESRFLRWKHRFNNNMPQNPPATSVSPWVS
jgi:peptidoglycan/LPS O-acetylase OafA/YrhL